MSCGCDPDNDICVRDGCCQCCYCGASILDNSSYHVRHVAPPEAPRCPRSDTGHDPLTFPDPQVTDKFIFASRGKPVSSIDISGIIVVQMCRLCGLVYWEPTANKGSS